MKMLLIGGQGLPYKPGANFVFETDEHGNVKREKPLKKGWRGEPIKAKNPDGSFKREGAQAEAIVYFWNRGEPGADEKIASFPEDFPWTKYGLRGEPFGMHPGQSRHEAFFTAGSLVPYDAVIESWALHMIALQCATIVDADGPAILATGPLAGAVSRPAPAPHATPVAAELTEVTKT